MSILNIQSAIDVVRKEILNHPLYSEIRTAKHLQIFMQHHVFAVWDFMSLLKILQKNLTCVSVPWMPEGNASVRYLINEIVVGEESDIDVNGNRKSHFEMYLEAMEQAGASLGAINEFLIEIDRGNNVFAALNDLQIPNSVKEFVKFTFEVIYSGKPHVQAAVFTFGREDLIPSMFLKIIEDLDKSHPEDFSLLHYYLQRHIEIDGDEHGHLAIEMTETLCADDPEKWEEAQHFAMISLEKRAALWTGVLNEIKNT